jgi:N-acetylglucosamine-6-phosphate deacetylase
VLITDAIGAAGSPNGSYMLGSVPIQVTDGIARTEVGGSLAGSTLTQDAALRRVVCDCGVSLPDAVRALSMTPARVLDLGEFVGSIAPGLRADLVVLDDDLRVHSVMSGGSWID